MAGMGRYPKEDDGRRNRAERQFDWTTLPAEGRHGPPPKLPKLRQWTDATLDWWAELWKTPQAAAWDQTGRTLHTLAMLHHQLAIDEALTPDKSRASTIAAEMRQHEDRHGLTPKAMLQLRWRVSATPTDGSGKVLHLVPAAVADRVATGTPDPAGLPAKRAGKTAWVDWAEAHGMERSTAEKLAKHQLIDQFSSVATTAPAAPPEPVRPVSAAVGRLRDAAKTPPKPVKPKRKRKT